jgi:hypothetical protein
VLLGRVAAPSTLGTFLRAFTFGHVRQLDRLLAEALRSAWRAGAGPGAGRLVVDVDSFVGEVAGRLKQGAAFGYTKVLGYHPLVATRADTGEVLHIRLRKRSAASPRGVLRFVEQLIARVQRAGATCAPWTPRASCSPTPELYPFVTNRTDPLGVVEAEHRQHAVVVPSEGDTSGCVSCTG